MRPRPGFALGNRTVEPGTRLTVDLPVSILSDHTPVTMSAHVVHGAADGPTVFVSAGIHGDEVIGIEIVRRLLKLPSLGRLRGTLVVVPIVNAFGFLGRSRYLPDRRDLNRCFPGGENGSLAARLAHLMMTEIVARADLGIDLHSAAVHRTNHPQVRVSPGDAPMRALAETFGAPLVIESALRPGSLRAAAREAGVGVLLYEAGEGLRFDERSVRVGLVGVLRVLRSLDMVPGRAPGPGRTPPRFCASSRWLRAPIGGLLRSFREGGAAVGPGEVLGVVSDPFGEVEAEIAAPFEGVVVGRAVLPIVNEGDAVFHLGRVDPRAPDPGAAAHEPADPIFDEDEIV